MGVAMGIIVPCVMRTKQGVRYTQERIMYGEIRYFSQRIQIIHLFFYFFIYFFFIREDGGREKEKERNIVCFLYVP